MRTVSVGRRGLVPVAVLVAMVVVGCGPTPGPPASTTTTSTVAAVPCLPGTFNATDGNEPCEPAPPGTFVDAAGAVAAVFCPVGSFQDHPGQTSCQLAPVGSYVDVLGATAATLCPEGTTTLGVGSRSAAECVDLSPTAIATSTGFGAHTCAVVRGEVRCWGDNSSHQLGADNVSVPSSYVPVSVPGISDAIAVAIGQSHSCALVSGGLVKCWGDNGRGQLGDGTGVYEPVPVTVAGLSGVTMISSAGDRTCALAAGAVWCWGLVVSNPFNQSLAVAEAPVEIEGIEGATDVSVGQHHSCAVVIGTVRCWGFNLDGQLGGPSPGSSMTPVQVAGIDDALSVHAGGSHTCAVVASRFGIADVALCWGDNSHGQLGNGTTTDSAAPVLVSAGFLPVQGITALSAGGTMTCAVGNGGTPDCWGRNASGQLGDGTTTGSNRFGAPYVPLGTPTTISAGSGYACAIVTGVASCWGGNASGRLGDGSTSPSSLPLVVAGL